MILFRFLYLPEITNLKTSKSNGSIVFSLASRLNGYMYSTGTSLNVALFILTANHLVSRLNGYMYSNGISLNVALFILMANHLLLFLG